MIYSLKETVTRERERRDKVYWSTFNAIEHFGAQPDKDSEQKAKAALNEARARGRSGMSYTEEDWVDDDATSRRGSDE